MTIHKRSLISLIRRYHIRIRLDCDPNFSADKATQSFTGVEELSIEVSQAQFGSSNYKVLRLFEGIRSVKRARIYGSVTAFPEYVRWLQGSMKTPQGMDFEQFDKEKHQEHLISNAWSFLPQKSSTQLGSPSRRRLSTKLACEASFWVCSLRSAQSLDTHGASLALDQYAQPSKLAGSSSLLRDQEHLQTPRPHTNPALLRDSNCATSIGTLPIGTDEDLVPLALEKNNITAVSDPNGEIDFGHRDHEYSSNEGGSEKLNLSEGESTDADQEAGEERADVTLDDAHYRPRPTVSRTSALDELCRLAKPLNVFPPTDHRSDTAQGQCVAID
ncbi:uncharacterized protein RSE6_13303 [Rhynchosporium secalis]|uniref:Uncharacterized protein n=1 Tax=Rhynchosporium secalis TaxID=38038 RepID=A0A1E1MSL7_RHYSE|nr:uncharacterized protein RSE6_13303 [Rhynchosporium secalis]